MVIGLYESDLLLVELFQITQKLTDGENEVHFFLLFYPCNKQVCCKRTFFPVNNFIHRLTEFFGHHQDYFCQLTGDFEICFFRLLVNLPIQFHFFYSFSLSLFDLKGFILIDLVFFDISDFISFFD